MSGLPPALLAQGRTEGAAERPVCAATESQASQCSPPGTHSPDLGSTGWSSGEGHHRHQGKGLEFLDGVLRMERSAAVRTPMNHKATEDGLRSPHCFHLDVIKEVTRMFSGKTVCCNVPSSPPVETRT